MLLLLPFVVVPPVLVVPSVPSSSKSKKCGNPDTPNRPCIMGCSEGGDILYVYRLSAGHPNIIPA